MAGNDDQINKDTAERLAEEARQTSLIMDEELRQELLESFKGELDEYLQILNGNLIKLEQNGFNEGLLQEIFRTAHSMKGTAGAFGLPGIQKVSHSLENLFTAVRTGRYALDKQAFDLCYDGLDLINRLMETELAGVVCPVGMDTDFAQAVDRLLQNQLINNPLLHQSTQVVSAESVNQAVNQASAPLPQPPANPYQAMPQFDAGATFVPTSQPVSQPVSQPPSQPAPEPVYEQVYEPVFEPILEPVSELPYEEDQPTLDCIVVDDELRRELIDAFKGEVDEYLQILNRSLIKLEQNGFDEMVLQEIFRTAHSMKGTAGAFGLPGIQKISHSLENLFTAVRSRRYALDKQAFDLCYEGLDLINRLMETELSGRPAPQGIDRDFSQRLERLLESGGSARTIQQPLPTMPPAATAAFPANNQIAANNQMAIIPEPRNQRQDGPETVVLQKAAPAQLPPAQLPPAQLPATQLPTTQLPFASTAQSLTPISTGEMTAPAANNTGEQNKPTLPDNKALEAANKTEFIRIPLPKIDRLMSDVGELLIARSRYEQRFNEVQNISNDLQLLLKDFLRLRQILLKTSGRRFTNDNNNQGDNLLERQLESFSAAYDGSLMKMKSLNSMLQLHAEYVSNDDLHLELLISSVQQEVQGLRMLPIETLFEPLRRRARDIARKQDKNVVLEMEGGETELDRQLIEAMRDPLVHLLTNSIDHGLEMPAVRESLGKNAHGTLRLSAGQRGNQIVIEISDDGGGIDITRVKEKAIANELYTERELESLSEQEILSILFRSGFSTKNAVTEISGRGVGLDVVKVSVEKLQGQIEVITALGQGTTFRITLPLTLSTQRVLLIKCANQIFGLPVNAIERVMVVESDVIFSVGERLAITVDGKPISLLALDELLNMPNKKNFEQGCLAMIINLANERAAFIIEDVFGEQEMVVKPLGKPLRKMKNIAGGAIMGDGSVVLLLNPSDIMRTIRAAPRTMRRLLPTIEEQKPVAKSTKRRILIVDDSITTRTLEKNILEMAGYEVIMAKDGQEGLDAARKQVPDMVISDVEMPRLNGFELITQIKSDVQLKNIPCLLVSSLDTQQDKARGAQAGADGYIVKGQFDQKGFLDIVVNLLSS